MISVSRNEWSYISIPPHDFELCTETTFLDTFFFLPGATQPIVGVYFTALYRALASSLTMLLDHTQRRATVGRTPLNE